MDKKVIVKKEKALEFLVDSSLIIEKLRVAAQVRQTHLKKQERKDPETDNLLERIKGLEKYVDDRVTQLIKNHPAYPWFNQVKGIGKENIGKVIGLVDIEKAGTISALWKFAGYSVENGKAPKRQKGAGKLSYNSRLRSMCWRLGTSLMKAKGKFYDYYSDEKKKYVRKCLDKNMKIVPASQLPKDKNGKRYEPEGVISEGHVNNYGLRKMIKLFLACLWLCWREATNLPTRPPYALEYQKHKKFISPWKMTDK